MTRHSAALYDTERMARIDPPTLPQYTRLRWNVYGYLWRDPLTQQVVQSKNPPSDESCWAAALRGRRFGGAA